MLIGYARVSTQEQDTAMQIDALRNAGVAILFEEKASGGSRRGRMQLDKCLSSLRPGDVLVCYKIDRVARSLFDLLDILRTLEKRQATIKSLTEPIDTTTGMGVFVVQILGAVAQLERAMILERTKAGLQAARARGKVLGRARALAPEDEAELVRLYLSGGYSYATLARRYEVSSHVAKRAVYRATKSEAYLKRAKA